MFQKGAKDPAIEIGANARLLDERTRWTADALCVSDGVQPRSSRQHGACPTQIREKTTTARRSHGRHLSPPQCVDALCELVHVGRFTTSVGTMICFVSGMNERSPRTACAIR